MRVAFVGKGGSGKSTLTAMFTDHLRKEDKKVLAVDADINVHLADLLGTEVSKEKSLSAESHPENARKLREHLVGNNPRIDSPEEVVKSTPPGEGSNLVKLEDGDEIIDSFAEKIDEESFLMHVGTYEEECIGASCYHSALWPFENLLSHLVLEEDEFLVADMVAGTDAFANTLHAQFDLIVLVVEPTPEGVDVHDKYRELAEEAGVERHLAVIGNKMDTEEDREFLGERIDSPVLGYLERNAEIKRRRQKGESIDSEIVENDIFGKVVGEAEEKAMTSDERLERLHSIHMTVAEQDYIQNGLGDITSQIDTEFSFGDRE